MLITGGSGLLGRKIASEMAPHRRVLAGYLRHPFNADGVEPVKLDITSRDEVRAVFTELRPAVVVHAAALVDADACERDPDTARKVNIDGTRNIALAARECGAKLAFISSDYVFDGLKEGPYAEDEKPTPLSHYGRTKAEGEEIARQTCPDSIVARVTVVYGWPGRPTFVSHVIDALSQGRRFHAVTDQAGNPTLADSAAEALHLLLRTGASGTFHVSGSECVTRYEFVHKIAGVFDLDGSLIVAADAQTFRQEAPRPRRCCLDVTRAQRLGCRLLNVEEGLLRLKEQMECGGR